MDAHPGEFGIEGLGIGIGGEKPILLPPVRNGAGHAVDELANGLLPDCGVESAVKILGGHDIGGEHRPALGDLNIFLNENDGALVVGNGGLPQVPVNALERVSLGFGKDALNWKSLVGGNVGVGAL